MYQYLLSMIYNKGLFLLLVVLFGAFELSHQTCPLVENNKTLIHREIELVERITNGEKFRIGDLNDTEGNMINVVKVKGTPYEMGLAYGQLLKDQLKDQLNTFYSYYYEQIENLINGLSTVPKFLKPLLIKGTPESLSLILELNVAITKKYTNPRYFQETRGIADGSGIDKKQFDKLNVFPELIKAACTVAGIWGEASAHGQTLHMRALDWDSSNPISKYPLITVYHPSDSNVRKHANIGWVGIIGIITGMSEKITIGQKVWLPKVRGEKVKTTRFGNPWTYVLRDVLSYADNMDQVLEILTKAHRTCTIHLGIGSVEQHSFRMFEYGQKVLNNYDDKNYTHYTENHPQANGIAYFDKHVQPSGDDCVGSLLVKSSHYGNWDAESFWRIVGASHTTGDTQLVVFNLQAQQMYISYSRNYMDGTIQKTEKAYDRSPILINTGYLWADF